jgi:hypothetical protein
MPVVTRAQCAVMIASVFLAACGGYTHALSEDTCDFPEPPTVVLSSGDAHAGGSELLQFWEVPNTVVYGSQIVPVTGSYSAFRTKLTGTGVETDAIDLLQRNRLGGANNEIVLAFAEEWIKPVNCLEMLLLGIQNDRMDLVDTPTEFAAFVTKSPDDSLLRIYFFTRNTNGIGNISIVWERLAEDHEQGWSLLTNLHNHNIHVGQDNLNGVVAPSDPDAQLNINMRADFDLQEAWITNGISTVRIPSTAFDRFRRDAEQ